LNSIKIQPISQDQPSTSRTAIAVNSIQKKAPNTSFNAFQIQTTAVSPFNYTSSLQPGHTLTNHSNAHIKWHKSNTTP
jgi:hypothetical protein